MQKTSPASTDARSVHEAPDTAENPAAELGDAESLIEEVSIDGMCGVY